ncbi:ferritin-like domain-containing protein [Halorubellus salinus]|uniref:ferritin-like domain-containing protein n=1 Tax=Halorubellus salinus TaxID=755309 RepID=UPI001D0735D3|nr:ferritin-like domain-containing protein [Halorubellus salinus]
MSLGQRITDDHQLARLLQIGVVLEEVVESRAHHHLDSFDAGDRDPAVEALLEDAADESAAHRDRLEALVADLNAETVPYEEINALVEAQYAQTAPEDFDDLLYDQLCNEETAYKFYDDLIEAIEASDTEFSIDRERVIGVLVEIREEEAEGVEEVTDLMEANR